MSWRRIGTSGLEVSDSCVGSDDGGESTIARLGMRTSRALPEALPGLVGSSPPMRSMARLVKRAAALDVPVLVRGESGTGKELVAQAIHRLGPRRQGPFVVINGASLSDSLADSALFGHARGAFTGASVERQGAFRRANGGTLFIDEIAALPHRVQALLLRALEEGTVTAVGNDLASEVNVRVVAATCEALEQRVEARAFREDLYQRLAVCVVAVPALRARPEDLPDLVRRLSEQISAPCRVEQGALALLAQQPFPGNVRELRNVLLQAFVTSEDGVIGAAEVASALRSRRRPMAQATMAPDRAMDLLRMSGGNVSAAARSACLPRSTFRDLLRHATSRAQPLGRPAAVAAADSLRRCR